MYFYETSVGGTTDNPNLALVKVTFVTTAKDIIDENNLIRRNLVKNLSSSQPTKSIRIN